MTENTQIPNEDQKLFQEKYDSLYQRFLHSIDDMPQYIKNIFGEARRVKRNGLTMVFRQKLNHGVKKGVISKRDVGEIVDNLRSSHPLLSLKAKKFLSDRDIVILAKPRNVILQQDQTDVSRRTSLSLYTFDTADTDPNVNTCYFNILKLYTKVRKLMPNKSMRRINKTTRVKNPVYVESDDGSFRGKEFLTYRDIERIRIWHKTFAAYAAYFKRLPVSSQKKIERMDVYLFPRKIQEWDKTTLDNIVENVGNVASACVSYANTIIRHRWVVMIIRWVMCFAVIMVLAGYLNFGFEKLTFLANLCIGTILKTIWEMVKDLTAPLKAIFLGSEVTGRFGEFGDVVQAYVKFMWDWFPSEVVAAATVTGAAFMGQSAVLAYVPHVLVGVFSAVSGVSIGGSLVILWVRVAISIAEDLKKTMGVSQSQTLSSVLAIHGVKYVCRFFDPKSKKHQFCERVTGYIQYVLATVSISYMVWDILYDLYIVYTINNELKSGELLSLKRLEELKGQSSCLGALFKVVTASGTTTGESGTVNLNPEDFKDLLTDPTKLEDSIRIESENFPNAFKHCRDRITKEDYQQIHINPNALWIERVQSSMTSWLPNWGSDPVLKMLNNQNRKMNKHVILPDGGKCDFL
jgi:hypothetical protein